MLFSVADLKSGIFMKLKCLKLHVLSVHKLQYCIQCCGSGDAGTKAAAALLDPLPSVSVVGW